MKQVVKFLLAAAAVAALAVPAMAADKLIVKNAAGTGNAFKVDDAGTVTVRNAGDTADVFTVNNVGNVAATGKLGVGVTNPFTNIHLHVPGTAVVAGTALYASNTALTLGNKDSSVLSDFVVADGTSTAGNRGGLRGVRARGTLEVPTAPLENDLVFSVIGGIYNGSSVYNSADINFTVDGTVTTAAAPQRISFRTRTNGAGAYVERLTMKANGNILMGLAGIPIYADNTAAASLTAGTIYRTATGQLMIKY